ncbi:hypothetical protein D6C91_07556 [Aureobasidium pullulans]|uniref:Uncharacterized protein n=1 Tax=Aureobasidium pullulans TaxID=5580 RepID=A0A4S9SQW9_AURPU|nr:hypothetical protein D6D13_05142 [Aureobasidium pullulans]THZ13999.1 hypothetical protein D6C91_07556 [Aureobasidium pullulans]
MAAHIETEKDSPAQIKTEQDSPAQTKIEHDSPIQDNHPQVVPPQVVYPQFYPGQGPLDVFTLPGVYSLRTNEWPTVEFKNEFRYRGVLVFELKIHQDPATVIDRKDPITVRVLVLRMSKTPHNADSKLVTYREETTSNNLTKRITYRGVPTLTYTGRGEDFRPPKVDNVHWCDGLRTDTAWDESELEQNYRRKELIERIAEVINIEDEDWEDVNWGEFKKRVDKKASLRTDVIRDLY